LIDDFIIMKGGDWVDQKGEQGASWGDCKKEKMRKSEENIKINT